MKPNNNSKDTIIVTADRTQQPGMVVDFVKKIFFIEILQGMSLTLKTFFKKPVTLMYPEVKRQASPGFRGLHALVRNSNTGKAKCVGCGLCAAICPSQCISIATSEAHNGDKIVDKYEIEILRCVFCAFCVEACPYGAIALTEHYEYSDFSRDPLYMTMEKLLDNWDKYMSGKKGAVYFERFWRPRASDFNESKEQAVFKGLISKSISHRDRK